VGTRVGRGRLTLRVMAAPNCTTLPVRYYRTVMYRAVLCQSGQGQAYPEGHGCRGVVGGVAHPGAAQQEAVEHIVQHAVDGAAPRVRQTGSASGSGPGTQSAAHGAPQASPHLLLNPRQHLLQSVRCDTPVAISEDEDGIVGTGMRHEAL